MVLVLAGLLLIAAAPVEAQDEEPVGPYVIDLRGAVSGVPTAASFFPNLPEDTTVPARGFGVDAGAHVYFATLGPSRLGVGANYLRVRGTVEGVGATVSALVPQVSFNFGSRNGWSYLSAGLGRLWVRTEGDGASGPATRESGGLAALNMGGGARWFLTRRAAVGFDVRLHRLGSPGGTVTAASVGFSLR